MIISKLRLPFSQIWSVCGIILSHCLLASLSPRSGLVMPHISKVPTLKILHSNYEALTFETTYDSYNGYTRKHSIGSDSRYYHVYRPSFGHACSLYHSWHLLHRLIVKLQPCSKMIKTSMTTRNIEAKICQTKLSTLQTY